MERNFVVRNLGSSWKQQDTGIPSLENEQPPREASRTYRHSISMFRAPPLPLLHWRAASMTQLCSSINIYNFALWFLCCFNYVFFWFRLYHVISLPSLRSPFPCGIAIYLFYKASLLLSALFPVPLGFRNTKWPLYDALCVQITQVQGEFNFIPFCSHPQSLK